MKKERSPYRFLFAAGGTGGHLFPAIAVAEKIKQMKPESEILFVGTKTKLEAEIVPKEGFDFKTVWISGFSRKINFSNILFPLKLAVSLVQSFVINFVFLPKVAVGAGAYVAGPVLWNSWLLGAKIALLEQNSYPGITNRLLERKANEIYLTFEDSKKYFRFQEKLFVTGNPVREKLSLTDKKTARDYFGLEVRKKTLLVLSGSLGARQINEALVRYLPDLTKEGLQIIWQTGERYFKDYKKFSSKNVLVFPFINEMEKVYSAADLVIARAGATTIAELSYLGLPVVFVPSPNVAADHQTKNVRSLLKINACEMIEDAKLKKELFDKVVSLVKNEQRLTELSENIKKFSRPSATSEIAERIIKLAEVL